MKTFSLICVILCGVSLAGEIEPVQKAHQKAAVQKSEPTQKSAVQKADVKADVKAGHHRLLGRLFRRSR